MKKKQSYFKDKEASTQWFNNWISHLERINQKQYDKITVQTSLGKTWVYGLQTDKTELPALVIFPGFRTTSLIWDLDDGLSVFKDKFRVFMIETNGQPNLSDGFSPSIRSLDYGVWGREVLDQLGLERVIIAGASFGGLVCMKISIVAPDRVASAVLLNPGCFRFVSLGWKNLYSNLLPILSTNKSNIRKFLDNVVFSKPDHAVSSEREELLVEYLEYVLNNYKDKTEKPYYMKSQLDKVEVDTFMLVGKHDILIPFQKSVDNARKHLKEKLKGVHEFSSGHGIETSRECLSKVLEIAGSYS